MTAVIGPSGCGKSTHIRTYNRIFNLYRDQRATGEIMIDGAEHPVARRPTCSSLRRRIGMIFQKPSPFPMTVFDNVAYGLRQHYRLDRSELSERVEDALKRSAIWDEVKHKLNEPGNALSGGQQQRLCIARAIAAEPERAAHGRALLGDRPGGHGQDRGAHPGAQEQVHDRPRHAQHAAGGARVSDYTAFFFQGRIVEFGPTTQIFANPAREADRGIHHRPLRLSEGQSWRHICSARSTG